MVLDRAPLATVTSLRVELLGGFRVWVGDNAIAPTAWRLRKAAALVKVLALAPDHRLLREHLDDLFWPEAPPAVAATNLRYVLHVARRTLGRTHLRREGELVVLDPPGGLTTDVEAFEEEAAAARRAGDPVAYGAALALYRGELLPDEPYSDWAATRRDALGSLHLSLLEELAALREACGERELAIATLERLVTAEPAHEPAHRALMRLYVVGGQRQRALEQYRRLRDVLRRDLDAEPDAESRALYHDLLGRGRRGDAAQPRHNLPSALTSFVGRDQDIADLLSSLGHPLPRLLTLTGPGGCGKSRLAFEVAHRVVARDLRASRGPSSAGETWFPDGVWLVELAALVEAELLPQTVAAALGLREAPERSVALDLVDFLRARKLLLLLDNCEHLADGLLRASPGLRILATSRQALGVLGEAVRPVPPLSVPDDLATEVAGLDAAVARSETGQLFVDRARLTRHSFALTAQNAPAVAQICRRLDGLPLAIELAAARLNVLSVEQIADRLDDRFRLLTGGGSTTTRPHQTLRQAIDWSYNLLAPAERRLFAHLSVFVGDFTIEAAEEVGGADLDRLTRLVEKSLVTANPQAETTRYRLLETLREYGREQLDTGGEAEATRQRHAAHYIALVERAEPELTGPAEAAWLEHLDREHANLRAALAWCLERDPAVGLRLAWWLWEFWDRRAYFGEARRWLECLLALASEPSRERARALYVAGNLAIRQGDRSTGRRLYDECLALAREVGDRWVVARTHHSLGWLAHEAGDDKRAARHLAQSQALWDEIGDARARSDSLGQRARLALVERDDARARALFTERLALVRQLGDTRETAATLCHLANVIRCDGEHPHAAALLEEARALYRQIGDKFGAGFALFSLADLARQQGKPAPARALFAESVALLRQIGSRHLLAECVGLWGVLEVAEGHPGRGVRLIGAAVAALSRGQSRAMPVELDRDDCSAALSAARAALGDDAYARAWAQGRATTLERAIDLVSADAPIDAVAPGVGHPHA